jgi:membrane-bound lytic murein transglycosylase D
LEESILMRGEGKVDGAAGAAYHRLNFVRPPTSILRAAASSQLHTPSRLLAAALVLLLAGCATPGPDSSAPPPGDTVVAPVAEPPAPPVVVAASAPAPFPAEVAAELESLPPPADDLWDRIRKGYSIADLDDPYVTKWEQWYSSRPDYVARMVDRSRRYLYYIVVEVEQRGMPLEVALLPMVESAFNPTALSASRAAGIWQFMPATGKDFGMKQTFWFDSRRDVIAATEGALAYLQKLYTQFGDWQLALAAYNWGEGNVARAIDRNQKAGLPTDYASLKMPDETRNYVPKLQAVKNIVRDPAKFDLELADIPDAPYFAVVRTTKPMDVKFAARLAEISVDEFTYLNPHHNRPVIAGADEYTILLPIDKAELFAAKLELSDQPLVSWQAYRTRPGESLPQVAAKFGLSVDTLQAVNGIGPKARVPVGHTLLVPSQRATEEAEATLAEAVFTTVPQGRTFYYKVVRGDTLSRIAARYNVSVQEIRQWNGLAQSSVSAGQRLRITSDLAPNAATAKRATGRAPVATKAPVKAKSRSAVATTKTKRTPAVATKAKGTTRAVAVASTPHG